METPRQKKWREFWEMVDLARDDRPAFYGRLNEMEQEDLANLYYSYEVNVAELKDPVFIEEMQRYADGNVVTEDAADDAAIWIVSRGEDYFLDILEHPEHIPATILQDSYPNLFDGRGAVIGVYEDRFGASIPLLRSDHWDR